MQCIRYLIIVSCILYFGCTEQNTPEVKETQRIEENLLGSDASSFSFPIQEEVFVPIYSDIYNKIRDYQLTFTLSIRNTSKTDSIFLKNVDYYDTKGTFVRTYLKNPIYVRALKTIENVISEKDTLGGSGANFLITWGANHPVKPSFQAVMIGSFNNAVFAFTTEGNTITTRD